MSNLEPYLSIVKDHVRKLSERVYGDPAEAFHSRMEVLDWLDILASHWKMSPREAAAVLNLF